MEVQMLLHGSKNNLSERECFEIAKNDDFLTKNAPHFCESQICLKVRFKGSYYRRWINHVCKPQEHHRNSYARASLR